MWQVREVYGATKLCRKLRKADLAFGDIIDCVFALGPNDKQLVNEFEQVVEAIVLCFNRRGRNILVGSTSENSRYNRWISIKNVICVKGKLSLEQMLTSQHSELHNQARKRMKASD